MTSNVMIMKIAIVLIAVCLLLAPCAADAGSVIWQEAESLSETGGTGGTGGWSNDPQHIDVMGSPYLLATGAGTPVADAHGEVTVRKAGEYRLWVRCRDWYPSHSPGTFQVSVGGKASSVTFGKAKGDDWQWVDGGNFELAKGTTELRIVDRTGWWGRVDAIVLATGVFEPADDLEELNAQRIRYNGVSTQLKEMGTFDVVVVGGGSSGLGAAIAAARNGAKVAFIQDRPVLGGNGSDEIQVPPMGYIGAAPDRVNVTGLSEELYPVQNWGSNANSAHLEAMVRAEKNISLFLNTRGIGVEMTSKTKIASVIGIDVHSGQRMRFKAPLFVDTTGHGWIGYYAGAEYRHGTEARDEFNEKMAPVEPNSHTMGNSLYKAVTRRMPEPTPFETPAWAYQWKSKNDFVQPLRRDGAPIRHETFDKATRGPGRPVSNTAGARAWFVETGGTMNTVEDAEKIRDELFRMHIGIWGYQKNYAKREQLKNHKLVWLNYVPGVRESRRLMGDYIMTQKDFDDQIEHADNVAFTDWGIDDHHPHGFFTRGMDVLHAYHGRRVSIPYRSLYSKNISNLFMAGRCMSASHMALGGVRVQRPMMATGQAVGTAAAIATREKCSPRQIHSSHITELQQRLLKDGCYIVGVKNEDPKDLALTAQTRDRSIINGWNREIKGRSKAVPWTATPIELTLREAKTISSVHVSLQNRHQRAAFDVEVHANGEWQTVASTRGDRKQRHYILNFDPVETQMVRLKIIKSNGAIGVCEVRIYEDQGWTTEKPFLKRSPSEATTKKPAKPARKLDGLIADDAVAKTVGSWAAGIYNPIAGTGYIHDENNGKGQKSVTFEVKVPKPGRYELKFLYTIGGNRSTRTPATVSLAGSKKEFIVNQKKSDGVGRSLGTYRIDSAVTVTISNRDTDGYVVVDGLQLLPVKE